MNHEETIDDDEFEDEVFWAELHGIHDVEFKTIRCWLETNGYQVVPDPSDEDMPRALETLIEALADLNVCVQYTDHLNDRQLYEFLIHPDRLNAHTSRLPNSFVVFDVIGSGSDEDNELYLRYYASEADRLEWKEQFADDELPPREKPPFDRDRHLPQPFIPDMHRP